MVKVVFVVWNSQFMREAAKAAKLALNEDAELVVRDIQSVNWKDDCSELLEENADLYVIYQMGKGEWEKEIAEKAKILAFKSSVDSRSVVRPDSELYMELYRYLAYDGMENLKNFVLRCLGIALKLCGKDVPFTVEKPVEMPFQGIYHPAGGYFRSYEEYAGWYSRSGRLRLKLGSDARVKKAAILFYRARFLFKNTAHVDMLVEELEKRGVMPIPVFCLTFPDREIGMPGVEKAIEDYILPAKPDVMIWGLYFRVSRDGELLKRLNVPVLNAIELYSMSPEEWERSERMNPTTLSMAVAMPEFDGAINPTVFSGEIRTSEVLKAVPIEERVRRIAEQAERWIELRRKKNKDKKVAVILHCSTTGNSEANSGTALGLDSFESVIRILEAMRREGYRVEIPSKDELIEKLKAVWEGKWGLGKSEHEVSYGDWFFSLPERVRRDVEKSWGECRQSYIIPGVWLGNVFVTVQPLRTENDAEDYHKLIHDPVLPPPHLYLAFYHFINGFDAAIHVGKHGSVEWLPGKSCGLSESCYPDVCLRSIPNGYIYIVNNPAEGTQAKRRGYSTIIDHLPPVMESAELYEDLEMAIEDYFRAKERGLKDQLSVLRDRIVELAEKYKFDDFDSEDRDFDELVKTLHSRVQNFNCSLFNVGLHVLGEVREPEKVALSAVRPELRLNVGDANANSNSVSPRKRKKIREAFLSLLSMLSEVNDGYEGISRNSRNKIEETAKELEVDPEELEKCLREGLEVLRRLEGIKEVENVLRFLNGEYVEPAPSGDLTRGRIEVIPTGFNFYSVDPKAIPTKTAWEVGKRLAEKLIEKFREDEGRIPETIAFVQWTSDPMNTDGEQIAQILYTLGVEPVWDGRRVSNLRVIPLEELGRPRIDVFLRISGLFRDTFMNLVELVDKAIAMVSSLDEPVSENFVRKHTLDGVRHRIFGDMPGAYGAGVNHAVNASAWESRDDLAEVFIEWGMYAYGRGVYGEMDREGMVKAMSYVDTVVRNHYTDEWDIFSDDCPYAFQAGLGLAVEKVRGERPKLYIVDTRPKLGDEKGRVVDVEEEVERVARITLLNDRWIEGMKKHGYKGAGDMMKRIVNMFGWEATADAVKDWIFEEVAKKYVLDEEMRGWFKENNPYAIEEIARRLLEAYRRGLWDASEEIVERIEEAYFDVEGVLED